MYVNSLCSTSLLQFIIAVIINLNYVHTHLSASEDYTQICLLYKYEFTLCFVGLIRS